MMHTLAEIIKLIAISIPAVILVIIVYREWDTLWGKDDEDNFKEDNH